MEKRDFIKGFIILSIITIAWWFGHYVWKNTTTETYYTTGTVVNRFETHQTHVNIDDKGRFQGTRYEDHYYLCVKLDDKDITFEHDNYKYYKKYSPGDKVKVKVTEWYFKKEKTTESYSIAE